jgi:hypothetical protein
LFKIDEAGEELTRGVELDRQPSFGEVDLNAMRASLQTAANLGLVLLQQIVEEFITRITGNLLRRIHETPR